MKKALLISGYLVPYVFLAMNEDALTGTPNFYFVMLIAFAALCAFCIKVRSIWIFVIGNVLSFISSCLFAWHFQTEKWEYYFKPFLPNQLIVFETVILFAIQLILAVHFIKKNKSKGD